MKRRSGLFVLATGVALVVSGCQTDGARTPSATSSAESASANTQDGRVTLKPGDAPELAGTWQGSTMSDSGYDGSTTLTLTEDSANTVKGVFEYRWGSGRYHRHPQSGSITGEIAPSGTLNFGSWVLTPERDGREISLRTRQRVGGYMMNLRWEKDVPPLPSER